MRPLLLAVVCSSCVVLPYPEWWGQPTGDDDSADDDDGDDDDDTTPPPTTLVRAHIVKPDGSDVPDLSITLCGDLCLVARTNEVGIVEFANPPVGDRYVLEPLFPIDGEFTRWSRFYEFVDVEAEGVLDLTAVPFVIPEVADAVDLTDGANTFDFDGMHVEVDGGTVRGPLGQEALRAFGAVEIPQERWPQQGLDGYLPLAAWATVVWDSEVEEGVGYEVSMTVDPPLADGATVAFLVAHYDAGIVSGLFDVHSAEVADGGATIRTPDGAGLPRATLWIAAVAE
jgi:hypothetical protein